MSSNNCELCEVKYCDENKPCTQNGVTFCTLCFDALYNGKEVVEKEVEEDVEEEEDGDEWFDRKFPDACCNRCDVKVDAKSVVFCGGGGGACETWYCEDCHAEGTHDCEVCAVD